MTVSLMAGVCSCSDGGSKHGKKSDKDKEESGEPVEGDTDSLYEDFFNDLVKENGQSPVTPLDVTFTLGYDEMGYYTEEKDFLELEGVITGFVDDLNYDGKDELIVVDMIKTNATDGRSDHSHKVRLSAYSADGGKVVLTDTYELDAYGAEPAQGDRIASFNSSSVMGVYSMIYLNTDEAAKEKRLVIENEYNAGMIGDGWYDCACLMRLNADGEFEYVSATTQEYEGSDGIANWEYTFENGNESGKVRVPNENDPDFREYSYYDYYTANNIEYSYAGIMESDTTELIAYLAYKGKSVDLDNAKYTYSYIPKIGKICMNFDTEGTERPSVELSSYLESVRADGKVPSGLIENAGLYVVYDTINANYANSDRLSVSCGTMNAAEGGHFFHAYDAGDPFVSVFGIRTGMSREEAEKILKDEGWTLADEYVSYYIRYVKDGMFIRFNISNLNQYVGSWEFEMDW